jgi:membrane-associated protease RseP (regulator of RpoE activity)
MILIVEILLSVAIAGLIHELGHYVAALAFVR